MKINKFQLVFSLFIIFIILLIFRNWFTRGILNGFDIPFLYPENLKAFTWERYAWSSVSNNGLGGNTINILNIDSYLQWGVKLLVFALKIPWNLAIKIMFFWPFLFFGLLSSFFLVKNVLKNNIFSLLGAFIYVTNTYILMLVTGGQMGLALGYSVCPLVFTFFLKRKFTLFTSSLSLLLLFDLRFTFLTLGIIFLWLVVISKDKLKYLKLLFLGTILALGIHGFWLLPGLFGSSLSLPEGYGNVSWLKFLSVASFSNSLSLLHPNWPENIFGKVYFMRPEFLGIPIIAFCSLFFIKKQKNSNNVELQNDKREKSIIIFFAFLGLLGAFLAKGVNPPFGEIYNLLFTYFPMFSAFRDPTKFYLLITLSYCVLIPYTLMQISLWWKARLDKQKNKFNKKIKPQFLVIGIFIVYWLYLLLPVFNGGVKGTFTSVQVPSEYFQLEKLVFANNNFSRTLVIPWSNRFIFSSQQHPVVSADQLFQITDMDKIVEKLQEEHTAALLADLNIQYVVIPDDFIREIFLTDRKYDASLKLKIEKSLDSISYLHRVAEFKKIDVYATANFGRHFYTVANKNTDIHFIKISPVKYLVQIGNNKGNDNLVFSEQFNPHWKLQIGRKVIVSQKTPEGLNSFSLDKTINGNVVIYYDIQDYVTIGMILSSFSLVLVLFLIFVRSPKKRRLFYIKILAVLLIFLLLGILKFSGRGDKNIIGDEQIWWTHDWQRDDNLKDTSYLKLTNYGGSEIRFNLSNSSWLNLQIAGWGSAVQIFANGQLVSGNKDFAGSKIPMYITEEQNAQRVDYQLNKDKKYEIRIRNFCIGATYCETILSGLFVSPGSLVSSSQITNLQTIAVLGDSISNSDGPQGYTYILSDRLGYVLHNAAIFGSTLTSNNGFYPVVDRFKKDIVDYGPDKAFILIGTNDLNNKVDENRLLDVYSGMLAEIKRELPHSHIWVMGLLNRYDNVSDKISVFNDKLKNEVKSLGLDYIDISDRLTKDDYMDPLHPAIAAQEKIADILIPYLKNK